ncbi:MAG: hypothetical protein AAFX04_11710 [Pseudomonadota bacterium]
MRTRQIQLLIAFVFFILGGWALLLPDSVIQLCLREEYRNGPALAFVMGCFGAQALIAGVFAATANFTRTTFIAYGLMLIGFLAFNIWFTLIDPVLTPLGGVADGIGNTIMILACFYAARRAEQ